MEITNGKKNESSHVLPSNLLNKNIVDETLTCLKQIQNKNILSNINYLYSKCFENLNHEMRRYVTEKETIMLKKKRNLVGCMTFDRRSYKNVEYVDLLLFGVKKKYPELRQPPSCCFCFCGTLLLPSPSPL